MRSFVLQSCMGLIRSLWRVGKWRVQKVMRLLSLTFSQSGFIEILKEVIYNENNATVLSNAMAALYEISKKRPQNRSSPSMQDWPKD